MNSPQNDFIKKTPKNVYCFNQTLFAINSMTPKYVHYTVKQQQMVMNCSDVILCDHA